MSNADGYAREPGSKESSIAPASTGRQDSDEREMEMRSEISLSPLPPQTPNMWSPSDNVRRRRAGNKKDNERRKKHFVIPRAPRRNLRLRSDSTQHIGNVNDNQNGNTCMDQTSMKEPPELQIEVISPFAAKLMLYLWYMLLVAAIVVESVESISLGVVSICGDNIIEMRHYDRWTSPCVAQVEVNDTTGLYSVIWEGGPYGSGMDYPLMRFSNLVISLASPDNWGNSTDKQVFDLEAYIPGSLSFDRVTTLLLTITCIRSSPRCEYAELPPSSVLNMTGMQRMSLKLLNLPDSLVHGVNESSIGLLYEKRPYRLGSLVWRYLFLVLSFLHLVRFVVHLKFTNTLYEQAWVILLQLSLFWYLNPLYALGDLFTRPSLVLEFLEYRFPTWFMAIAVGFMFSAITASMSWIPSSTEERKSARRLRSFKDIKAFLCLSRSIFDPPIWTKIVSVIFIVVIIALDIVDMTLRNTFFTSTWGRRSDIILFTSVGILFSGSVVCCGLLFYLNRNLGQKSYLDSRPQQLACRVFIVVFVAAIIFYIVQVIIFFARYSTIPGIATTPRLNQLPAIMVATFLVNIMTLVYTTHNRSSLVPVNPRDQRWKYMVWPNTWYRWLSRHGGSMYIFHSEEEELTFNWNQYAFRMRQHMAKVKRRQAGRSHGVHSLPLEVGPPPSFQSRGVLPSAEPFTEANGGFHMTLGQGGSVSNGPPPPCEDSALLNMDRTSTYFLPEHPHRNVMSSKYHSPRNCSFGIDGAPETNADVFFCPSSDIPHNFIVNTGEQGPSTHVHVPPSHLSECVRPQDADGQGPLDTGDSPKNSRHAVETSAAYANKDSDGERMVILVRALSLAREKLNSLIRSAERAFISGPVHAFEHMETAFLDLALRPFLDREYLPFFNLETAIDCFNLSWEAYGASQLMIRRMGREQPMTVCRFFSGCCCSSPSSSESESDTACAATDGSGNYVNTNAPPPINVERYGYHLIVVMEALRVQVVISEWDGANSEGENKAPRIVIAFRGTANVSNARQDLRVRREVWDEMSKEEFKRFRVLCGRRKPTVHSGFLSIWEAHRQSIHDAVWEFLSSHPSTVYRIFCTGHSLGGALACLCAYSVRKMLVEREYPLPEVTVYTFGQPPLGNKAFQIAYNRAIPRTFRVVNESDAVSLIGMYGCHIGIEVDIDRHGNYICKPMFIERLFRPTKGKGFAVESHLMGNYATSLNAITRGTNCPTSAVEQGTSEP